MASFDQHRSGRYLSMSAFNALMGLRQYLAKHPNSNPIEAAEVLQRIDGDLAGADFATALELHKAIPGVVDFQDVSRSLRHSLEFLIEQHRPWWRAFFPSGRSHVRSALTDDEQQIFYSARLFDVPASAEIMLWWYRISAKARSDADLARSTQGGEAEILTLQYERDRLASLGIFQEPEWIAIESNSAGFDVRSFDPGPVEPVARLIEVKSTRSDPPRMILPRSEWQKAQSYGHSYYFYIWSLPEKNLTIKRVDEILLHVPSDNGSGKWTEVEISFF